MRRNPRRRLNSSRDVQYNHDNIVDYFRTIIDWATEGLEEFEDEFNCGYAKGAFKSAVDMASDLTDAVKRLRNAAETAVDDLSDLYH